MYPILYKVGFASQPTADRRDDGLKLIDCYITAAVRCAPPDNKPLPSELANCCEFLDRELAILSNVKVVVALGKIGFDAYLAHLKRVGSANVESRDRVRSRQKLRNGEWRHAACQLSPVQPEHGNGKADGSHVRERFPVSQENDWA